MHAYRGDHNLRYYLVRTILLLTRLLLMRTTVRSSVAGPAVTPASSPTPSHLSIFQVEASFLHRNTRISEKVVYAIKCRACHRICIGETVRRLDARFREHLRKATRLRSPCWTLFCFSGYTTQDMLVLTAPLWSQCGLWFHLKLSRAVNVAII